MADPTKRDRPGENGAANSHNVGTATSTSLTDLDALAENLRGVYVLQVVVSNAGHRRTYYYKNLESAQRAVRRAHGRGRDAHLSLVQMVPVGTVGGGLR